VGWAFFSAFGVPLISSKTVSELSFLFKWFPHLTISDRTGEDLLVALTCPRRTAFLGQSHRTGHRHSLHLSATGNEPEAKGLPPEEWCLQKTPSGGDIFVEKCTVYRITPGRGEIFFNKSTLGKEIVPSLCSR